MKPCGTVLFLIVVFAGGGWMLRQPTAAWGGEPASASPATVSAAQRSFFEKKIRPVLVEHCYGCHAADVKDMGGKLRLDSREGLLTGGESGPSVIPGRPEESLLIHALRYESLEMPPDAPLPETVVHDFVTWVKMGAPDPRFGSEKVLDQPTASAQPVDESLWAFQPVRDPELPEVQNGDWCYDPIDRFILAKIDAADLFPADDAEPVVLARRLYFDLIGLPPTIEQVESFAADYRQHGRQAVERLVDALLASPEFGPRWGRHWLDVARYGESNGNDGLSRNPTFPHAWRYRDYVIQSFNNDIPYNQFLTEQIAGDLLPADSPAERDRLLVATGFLALGSKPAKAMNVNFNMDVVADQIEVVSTGVMGLSVACARCHDHKHDPIPTRDYYALAGIFASTETLWGPAANEPLTAPATPLHELQATPPIAPSAGAADAAPKDPKAKKSASKFAASSGAALAMGVREHDKPADCKINIKGESNKLGPSVPRGFVSACSAAMTSTQQAATELTIAADQSGRLQLARWLTRSDHPQTARVLVNRVWLHLFGEGIVRTPDDFGVYGDRPTHPELLDHLAGRFVAEGWSIKRLIRTIVLSRAYQLSSTDSTEALQADPNNQLFGRQNRRRLDTEALRDSMLAVSGELDFGPGQGSAVQHLDVLVNKSGSLHKPSDYRSVYLCLLRNSPPPELAAFNLPDGIGVTGKRDETTLPSQALFLINNPFVVQQSRRLAERMLSVSESDGRARVRWIYRRVLNREPDAVELRQAEEHVLAVDSDLVPTMPDATERQVVAWASLCQALLASSEFRYVD